MTPIAINLTLIQFIVVPLVAIIFGCTVYFFIKSRKALRETLEAARPKSYLTTQKEKEAVSKRNALTELEEHLARRRHEASKMYGEPEVVPSRKTASIDENMVYELKSTIGQQQKLLNSYLGKIEELENEGKQELRKENNDLQKEITKLHEIIEKKDDEIEELYQQASTAKKMAARIDEVYAEFEQLQLKMQTLERQAGRANALAIELEDTKNEYEVIHKELARKHEKLEAIMEDNRTMRDEMNMLEDKLSEANLQRQQLQKKVQFLTDMNNDMQSISDTNKKLQTELRRIGELESMLTMMAEERDYLLRKKIEK
jgi:chromosome segregation ATPase